MTVFLAILKALAGIPAAKAIFDEFVAFYIAGVDRATASMISDAAAVQARAETDDDRFKASQAWRDALSRPRMRGLSQ